MIGSRQQIARRNSDFFRDQFHKIILWLFVSVTVILALIVTILYFIYFEPTRNYYGNTTEGKILPMSRPI